jgi:hypothetical protein
MDCQTDMTPETIGDLEVAFLRAAARAQLRADSLTVKDASRMAGVTRETLSRVLCGHRVSRRLCRFFLAKNTQPQQPA